jgi:hypothetical protein
VPLARSYERQLIGALGASERAALERALLALESRLATADP